MTADREHRGRAPMAAVRRGDRVHVVGHPDLCGPVTSVGELDGVIYARFSCTAARCETGWLRLDQLQRVDL